MTVNDATDKSFGCRFANTEKCADSCFKCELFHRDYISREAAAGQLRSYKIERDLMVSHNDTIDFAISVISAEVPPADVRPVVRGKWIAKGMGFPPEPRTVCSCCGYDIDLAVYRLVEIYDGSVGLKSFKPNFCPSCGADMREVKSDEK